jgi:N,N'-diacetyllegionaminate synthase
MSRTKVSGGGGSREEGTLFQKGLSSLGAGGVFLIAEAGVNHNGSLETALGLVDAAAAAGADAVKFQTFRAEAVASRFAPKAEYQKHTTDPAESQVAMLKRLELDRPAHEALLARCRERGIRFLSTPFDLESIDLLVGLGLDVFKIPSGEITNLPYLRRIGSLGAEVILSTGMAELAEVGEALAALAAAGTRRERVALLHCTTEYPAPFAEVNLRAMLTLGQAFPGVRVGYSDHTAGIEAAIAAAALGACVIEKHFTLDRGMEGPDHKASLEPGELAALVAAVRNVQAALGDGIKRPAACERKNRAIARKCLVAARPIRKGAAFAEADLAVKRAGVEGVSPMRWDEVLGRPAPRDFAEDEPIALE